MARGNRKRKRNEQVPFFRTNEQIKAPEVRVVSATGEMIGIMPVSKALSLAASENLDLVEISPKADPPVCKIIDYGKFIYEQKKKEKAAKRAAKAREMKGIRLSFRIGPGDLERQRKRAEEFLSTGHPIKIQMMMRGREKAHKDLAFEKLNNFIASLEEVGMIDQNPKLSGFQITAILKPKNTKK